MVYESVPRFESDSESFQNLNMCKDTVTQFMNNYLNPKRSNDKLSQAQAKVDEVRLVMEGNVRKMIENQKDFAVTLFYILLTKYRIWRVRVRI